MNELLMEEILQRTKIGLTAMAKEFMASPSMQTMPESTLKDLRNGTVIMAIEDLDERGLPIKKGDFFMVGWNGKNILGGGLNLEMDQYSWAVDQLANEITNWKIWQIVGQGDEWMQGKF
jgi:hypothetical protein